MPNLESPECSAARGAVREAYSFHFGNDMEPSPEYIELRSKFTTATFKERLEQLYRSNYDVKPFEEFTKTVGERPKAFRVGKCTLGETKTSADIEVLLFWKDDNRNDQRTISVATLKEGEKWLINDVSLLPE